MVDTHVNSRFNSVTYRIGDVMIDPGDVWSFEGVRFVLLTHCHFDHIYGLNDLLRINPEVKVITNEAGREGLFNARKNMSFYFGDPFVFNYPDAIQIVDDKEEVRLSKGITGKAVFTPGHNPSCITWILGDSIFSGDSLIPGIKTVTNLPGCNKAEAICSESIIRSLSVNRQLYPGHPSM